MIAAIILLLHGILLVGTFFWKLRSDGITEAALSAGFIVIIFSIGWTLSGLITGMLFEPEGLAEWLNRDTLSLVLVTLGEIVFYVVFLKFLTTKGGGEAKPE